MAFFNSPKLDHFSGKMLFLSPPVTPKQIVESTFTHRQTDEDCWDSTSTEASSSPSSSSLYYSPTPDHCVQKRDKAVNSIFISITPHRRKQRPVQSLPASTKGTFRMPTFVEAPMKKIRKRVKINTAKKIPLLCLASNDAKQAPPNPLPLVKAVTPNQNMECSDNLAEDEQEQIITKAKTSAAYVYDSLRADVDQSAVFLNSEEWIPKVDVFDRRPMVRISWKGILKNTMVMDNY